MDAFDELVGEALAFDDDILALKTHLFGRGEARVFQEDTSGLTVVVPLNYQRAADDDDEFMTTFSELWARHTFPARSCLADGFGSHGFDELFRGCVLR